MLQKPQEEQERSPPAAAPTRVLRCPAKARQIYSGESSCYSLKLKVRKGGGGSSAAAPRNLERVQTRAQVEEFRRKTCRHGGESKTSAWKHREINPNGVREEGLPWT